MMAEPLNLNLRRPTAEMVPRTVEMAVERRAMRAVFLKASRRSGLAKSRAYQLKVKPVKMTLSLDSLKEKATRIKIGRKSKSKTK